MRNRRIVANDLFEGDDWNRVLICQNPYCEAAYIPGRVRDSYQPNAYCSKACATFVNVRGLRAA